MPSTRSKGEGLVLPISEPERSITRRLRVRVSRTNQSLSQSSIPAEPVEEPDMGDQPRPLKSYAIPSQEEPYNNFVAPPIEANNFELKPSLLSVVQQNQFFGGSIDDPNLHLSMFLQYADTVKNNGVNQEAIRIRLFPFSLRDRAQAWL